jgi:putative DNA primase/helicase
MKSPSPQPVEAQDALDRLMGKYLPVKHQRAARGDQGSLRDQVSWNGMPESATDGECIEKMFSFKNGSKARRLWNEPMDEAKSEGDLALCSLIAFVAGPNPERIDRIFRCAARLRPKWDERHRGDGATYGEMTIETALSDMDDFYAPRESELDPQEQARRQDETIAREFVKRHEGDFLYVPEETRPFWLRWNGNRWVRDLQAVTIRGALLEFGRQLHREADEAENKERERLHSHGKRLGNAAGVRAVLKLVEVEVVIDPSALDADPDLLSVANGTLELRTDRERGTVAGRLRPAEPNDLITCGIDVAYKPDADSSLWDRLGRDWFPDALEKWAYIEEMAGYHGLHGEAGRMGVVSEGSTHAEKSTLEDILDGTLSGLSYAGSMTDFAPRQGSGPHSGWARTLGKRIGFVSEGEDGLRLDEGLIKRALGGAPTSFEEKYEKSVQAIPTMTPFFDTNHLPTVEGADDAIFKRLKLVEWPRRFYLLPEEQDLYDQAAKRGENPGKVRRELEKIVERPEVREGVLAALVRALVRADRRGGVEVPPSVVEATRRWQGQANTLASFVDECLARDPDGHEPVKDVLQAFNEYAKEHGRRTHSQDWLSKELKKAPFWIDRGRPYVHGVQTRCYMGVKLKSAL